MRNVSRRQAVLFLSALVVLSPRLCGEIRLLGVTTSAGFKPGLPGPGSPATVFVTGLKIPPVIPVIVGGLLPMPTEIAGITVTYADSTRAPIFGVADLGAYQIVNFQVPWEAHLGPAVLAQDGQYVTIPSDPAPWGEFFTMADGFAVAAHASDFSTVSAQNPVRPGEWIVLYASNLGPVTGAPQTGVAAPTDRPTPLDPGTPVAWQFHVLLRDPSGDRSLESNYLGLAPGLTGVYQINVRMPDTLPSQVSIYVQRDRNCGFFFTQGCGRGEQLDFSVNANLH